MSSLSITVIDVGWGDSILIESQPATGQTAYALIDSNDEPWRRSSIEFLRKRFRTLGVPFGSGSRLFDFVMATHAHADHISGLRRIVEAFGTKRFYYPLADGSQFADLVRYAENSRRSNGRIRNHEHLDTTAQLPSLGDAQLTVLWPPPPPQGQTCFDPIEPNNNSIVLGIRLDRVKCILSGDCLAENWQNIIPWTSQKQLRFIKIPHHGARNSTFDANNGTPWFALVGSRTKLAMSTHVSPHRHPHNDVLAAFAQRSFRYYRTDHHYHVRFWTDGRRTEVYRTR